MKSSAPQPGPVWAKRVESRAGSRGAQLNLRYCAGRDVAPRPPADSLLIDADLWTNRAHAVMLARQGILERVQAAAILRALDVIAQRAAKGEFIIPPECEDVHMAIEAEVTRLAGPDSGGWLHAGRSRNDQTTTDCRIYARQAILDIAGDVADLIDALIDHASRHLATVCPGFTHMQPAMVTTWGHVVAGWAQGLLRDLERLDGVFRLVNRSPLGAAAAFGTSWPIDRALTARLLGFEMVQDNSLDCISSRGEMETHTVAVLAMFMNRLAGVGQDLILLSTPPRAWVRLDDAFVTGSSIMPQKRNPDFAEVTRAKAAVIAGIASSLLGIGRAAPAGYNRDTQWTKYLLLDAVAEIEGAAPVFQGVFETLKLDAKAMRAACDIGFMNAAEVAEALAAASRLAFRSCYKIVAETVALCEAKGQLDRDTINKVIRDRWSEFGSRSVGTSGAAKSAKTSASKAKGRSAGGNPPSGSESSAPFQFDAALWKTLDDPLELVRRRTQAGSPHPDRVRETLSSLRGIIATCGSAIDSRRKALAAAREALAGEIRGIVKPSL